MTGFRQRTGRVVLAGLVLLGVTANGARLDSTSAEDRPAPIPRFVCFGHADAEGGVALLYPLSPGRVDAVAVKENQEVKGGEVLARLDRRQAEMVVRAAQADWEAARAQYERALKLTERQQLQEAQQQAAVEAVAHRLRAAEWVLSRKEDLKTIQTNDKEVEAGRAQVAEFRAVLRAEEKKLAELRLNDPALDIRRAREEVEGKRARLEQARLALDECELRAPGDGTVLRIGVAPGDVLGAPARQPAVWFCPKGRRVIRAEVEQEFAGRLEVGQPVVVQDDARARVTWRGRVESISDWYTHRRSILQEPLQHNDVRTLECRIALDTDQPPPRIGQRVRVTVGDVK